VLTEKAKVKISEMKAVIEVGNKQYLVEQDKEIEVELLNVTDKTATFAPLLVIDGETVYVGQPLLDKSKVVAEIIEADAKADKVTAIRYKAKKRVHKVHGHRQHYTKLKITKIS
jgi:large subunit ribosomal protein L21